MYIAGVSSGYIITRKPSCC